MAAVLDGTFNGNGKNYFKPDNAEIKKIIRFSDSISFYRLSLCDEKKQREFLFRPGQFIMLSLFGIGEFPVSISSPPWNNKEIELTIRSVGRVTNFLKSVKKGSVVGLRGPYGNGFPVHEMEGHDIVLVAGGLGIAPLRSLLYQIIKGPGLKKYGSITLLYGAKTEKEILFLDELKDIEENYGKKNVEINLIVNSDETGKFKNRTGFVTDFIDKINVNPDNSFGVSCGPPLMFKKAIDIFSKMGFSKEKILLSLERRMECGIGVCAHCAIGYKLTCVDGPIFNYYDALSLPEMI